MLIASYNCQLVTIKILLKRVLQIRRLNIDIRSEASRLEAINHVKTEIIPQTLNNYFINVNV